MGQCKRNFDLGHQGVSLIQTMVAVMVSSIVLYGITSQISNLYTALKRVQEREAVSNLNRQLEGVFADQTLCGCMFKGFSLNGSSSIQSLAIGCNSNASLLKVGDAFDQSIKWFKIKGMKIENIKNIATGLSSLTIKFDFDSGDGYSHKALEKTVIVNENSGSIGSCGQVTVSQTDMCSYLGGTVNPGNSKCTLPSTTTVISGGGGGGGYNPTYTPSASLQSYNCSSTTTCWVSVSVTGKPGDAVLATGQCDDGNGNNLGGTNNTNIGTINNGGTFGMTAGWDCTLSPKSGCTQSYTVGGVSVGSHSWRCQ